MKIKVYWKNHLGEIFLPEDNMYDLLDITICQFTDENIFHIRSKNFGDPIFARAEKGKIVLNVDWI